MAYTRPTYNADAVTWLGEATYARPAYNAADVTWAEGLTPGQESILVEGQTPSAATGLAATAAQAEITLTGQVPTSANGYANTPTQADITLQGQTPKSFLDTFKPAPLQGAIATEGQIPTKANGFVLTATQRAIALSGQKPTASINQFIYAHVTGRGFSQAPNITVIYDDTGKVNGQGFTQSASIFGGSVVTGKGFKSAFTATAIGDNTAYAIGYGFTTSPSITVISASNARVSGRGFTQTVGIFGGAVITGTNFNSSLSAATVSPESARATGQTFKTSPTLVGYAIHSAAVTGRGFVSGIAYAKVTGRGFVTTPILKAEFTAEFAEAFVMNITNAAVLRYESFAFSYITKIGNKYYGVTTSGLYELLEDDTSGRIVTNDEDVSVFNSKNIPYVYLNGDDDYQVTAIVDNVEQPTFNTGFAGRRARLSRGSKGRYWTFRVTGIRDLYGFESLPDGLSRKVK